MLPNRDEAYVFTEKKSAAGYPSFDRINQIRCCGAASVQGRTGCVLPDRQTGHVEEVMYIREDSDLREFLEHYGLSEQDLKKNGRQKAERKRKIGRTESPFPAGVSTAGGG